jgi:hypothetical protein
VFVRETKPLLLVSLQKSATPSPPPPEVGNTKITYSVSLIGPLWVKDIRTGVLPPPPFTPIKMSTNELNHLTDQSNH